MTALEKEMLRALEAVVGDSEESDYMNQEQIQELCRKAIKKANGEKNATGNTSELIEALKSVERVFQLYNGLDLSDMGNFRDWDSAFDEAQSKVKTALAKVRGEE